MAPFGKVRSSRAAWRSASFKLCPSSSHKFGIRALSAFRTREARSQGSGPRAQVGTRYTWRTVGDFVGAPAPTASGSTIKFADKGLALCRRS